MVERQYRVVFAISPQTDYNIDFEPNQAPTARALYRTLKARGVKVTAFEREVGNWKPSTLEETVNKG